MIDKVQKIKDWISKERDGLMDAQGNFEYPEHKKAYHILCNLDAYIDSLQEEPEPQFKVGDTIRSKVWERAVHEIVSMDDSAYYFENGGKIEIVNQELWELVEEPVSEDLEEAAKNHAVERFRTTRDRELAEKCKQSFKAGAKWQIAKLMANATEATVHIDAGSYPYIPQMELYDYDKDVPLAKKEDKYKVVLIKEE